MKKILICGVSGQDGAYLAKLLLDKGNKVYGGARSIQSTLFSNLIKLGIKDQVELVTININDFRSVLQNISDIKPDEIYNLAGQSSVSLSFEQPVETLESISVGTLNILEAIRFSKLPIRFYNAGSSECFGNGGTVPANEMTAFRPRSPYAVAKSAAFWEVANYREAYNMFAVSGILFNHESPLRGESFVTRKISRAVSQIALGQQEIVYLGNLDAQRDWGHASDYVKAMWLMLQQDIPEDYVIATGSVARVRDFVRMAFEHVGIELKFEGVGIEEKASVIVCNNPMYQISIGKIVVAVEPKYFRPTDIDLLIGDPTKSKTKLGWTLKHDLASLVKDMMENDLATFKK
jgi:GDPmannose 4,6-dehydratase